MNILFIIYSFSKGKGGHFYSLKSLASELENIGNAVTIVGLGYSGVKQLINNNKIEVIELGGPHLDFLRYRSQIIKIVQTKNINIIHAFDNFSFPFGRLASNSLKIPIILTKCGGPSPHFYYPFNDQLIIFSKEDQAYFANQNKFKQAEVHLIPNRSQPVEIDEKKIQAFQNKYLNPATNKIKLFRIARISPDYEKSLIKTINYSKLLNQSGIACHLFIIGVIQSSEVFERLAHLKDDSITIITSYEYTRNASTLLNLADFVIATGRGVMEAASLKKIIFTDNSSSDFPVLVTEGNIDKLFATNFSPRNEVKVNFPSQFKCLKEMLNDIEKKSQYEDFIYSYYLDKFSVKNAIYKYQTIYEKMKYKQPHRLDLLISLFQTFRRFFQNKS